jgi:hypothetical protein
LTRAFHSMLYDSGQRFRIEFEPPFLPRFATVYVPSIG